MKAYRLDAFTSLDDLRLQEEDDPRLQRGEVLVRVRAVSLNFRDIAVGSREGLQDVPGAIAMAGIKPVIDRVFDFERAKEAVAHLESGSHFGKVVIRCSAPAADAGNKS